MFNRVFLSSYSYQSFRREWNLQKWKVVYHTRGKLRVEVKEPVEESMEVAGALLRNKSVELILQKLHILWSLVVLVVKYIYIFLPLLLLQQSAPGQDCELQNMAASTAGESVKNSPQNMHMPWDEDDEEAVEEKWQTAWYFSHIAQLPLHVFAIPPKLQMMVMINFIRTLALTFSSALLAVGWPRCRRRDRNVIGLHKKCKRSQKSVE